MLQQTIESLYRQYRNLNAGELATYIPELAKADPDMYCIAIQLIDGTQHVIGDEHATFTIQSVSKPLALGQALCCAGRNEVIKTVGVEPTGNSFSSLVGLDAAGMPLNPMVNAGAIATTSLLPGDSPATRYESMRQAMGLYLGQTPELDNAVYQSEQRTGDRNRALGYLLKSKGTITGDVEQHIDLYFKQCSLLTTAPMLACAAATLANYGVNPTTKQPAIEKKYVRDILTVMYMNGMYDYAGRWAYEVGIPAKSGVSGAIMAIVPGLMGIAVYSPRLDTFGNSVRGLATCRDFIAKYNMHIFDGSMNPTINPGSS